MQIFKSFLKYGQKASQILKTKIPQDFNKKKLHFDDIIVIIHLKIINYNRNYSKKKFQTTFI